MKFGESSAEHEEAIASGGGGGDGSFIKYMKKGDNTFQILDEYEGWVWYWEHYNPGGYPFPCTRDRATCPGCTSTIEKMQRASRRAAFNVYDGQYTNVMKVPKTVADKLKNRSDRLGTITDRPYTITRIDSESGTDYDIEGGEPTVLNLEAITPHLQSVEDLLAKAYDEAWGDSAKVKAPPSDELQTQIAAAQRVTQAANAVVAQREAVQKEDPPSSASEETHEYSEAKLLSMAPHELIGICVTEGLGIPPVVDDAREIVNWMKAKVS